VLQIDEELPRGKMGILEDVLVVGDLPAGNAGVAQKLEPVRGRLRPRDVLDQGDERGAVTAARVGISEARV